MSQRIETEFQGDSPTVLLHVSAIDFTACPHTRRPLFFPFTPERQTMKSFTHFFNELNEGSTHAAVSADLAELLRTVQSTGRGGALTLKIKIAPATRSNGGSVDKVTIVVDRKLESPKPEQPSDFFWLTEDGETTRNHPRQQSLPLREVQDKPQSTFKTV
jgi:hypothetical protein